MLVLAMVDRVEFKTLDSTANLAVHAIFNMKYGAMMAIVATYIEFNATLPPLLLQNGAGITFATTVRIVRRAAMTVVRAAPLLPPVVMAMWRLVRSATWEEPMAPVLPHVAVAAPIIHVALQSGVATTFATMERRAVRVRVTAVPARRQAAPSR